MKQLKEEDAPARTFFTSLPQTQQELEELSINSSDYQIKEYVKDLFKAKGCTKQEAQRQIVKFFNAYEAFIYKI